MSYNQWKFPEVIRLKIGNYYGNLEIVKIPDEDSYFIQLEDYDGSYSIGQISKETYELLAKELE